MQPGAFHLGEELLAQTDTVRRHFKVFILRHDFEPPFDREREPISSLHGDGVWHLDIENNAVTA